MLYDAAKNVVLDVVFYACSARFLLSGNWLVVSKLSDKKPYVSAKFSGDGVDYGAFGNADSNKFRVICAAPPTCYSNSEYSTSYGDLY